MYGVQTFAFQFTLSTSPTIVWQKMTYYTGEDAYGIVFGSTENVLYAFSKIKTNNFVVARINAVDGSVVWY